MGEMLAPHPRSRSIVIVSLLLTLQGISALGLAALVFVLGMSTVRNAVAAHKPTAAALTTAFAALGGGMFFILGLLAFLFAWGLWRQKGWVFWGSALLEGLFLLLSLASLYSGSIWFLLSEGVLAGVILVYLCADRHVQAASRR